MDSAADVSDATVHTAVAFIAQHPRCSIIDLEPVLQLGPAQVWRVIHELENRRLVQVESTPSGFRFTAPLLGESP